MANMGITRIANITGLPHRHPRRLWCAVPILARWRSPRAKAWTWTPPAPRALMESVECVPRGADPLAAEAGQLRGPALHAHASSTWTRCRKCAAAVSIATWPCCGSRAATCCRTRRGGCHMRSSTPTTRIRRWKGTGCFLLELQRAGFRQSPAGGDQPRDLRGGGARRQRAVGSGRPRGRGARRIDLETVDDPGCARRSSATTAPAWTSRCGTSPPTSASPAFLAQIVERSTTRRAPCTRARAWAAIPTRRIALAARADRGRAGQTDGDRRLARRPHSRRVRANEEHGCRAALSTPDGSPGHASFASVADFQSETFDADLAWELDQLRAVGRAAGDRDRPDPSGISAAGGPRGHSRTGGRAHAPRLPARTGSGRA